MGACCCAWELERTLSGYDLYHSKAIIFVDGQNKSSLALYKEHENYPDVFAKIVALQGKQVIITYDPPGFSDRDENAIVDVIAAPDAHEYSGVIRHVVWLGDNNVYEVIFKRQKRDHLFVMQKKLYEEHVSELAPGAECVISFEPRIQNFYQIKEISFPSVNKKGYSLLPEIH